MGIRSWFRTAETADAVAAELVTQEEDVDISDGTLEAMAEEYGLDPETFIECVRYDLGETRGMWPAWRHMFKKGN